MKEENMEASELTFNWVLITNKSFYVDVLQRWEILQARMMDRDYRMSQHRQDWGQFKADLDHMVAWLDEAEALHGAQSPGPRDITELDSIIRHHKVRFFL